MSDLESLTRLPEDFDGTVRLFPLPGVVTFPHVMQPLHIFEPRYCDMLCDSLSSNRLIAMATLLDGWEQQYDECPEIAPYACIGKVVSHTPTDDDRHNILLLGMQRVRLVREVPKHPTYRTAEVEVLTDVYPSLAESELLSLKRAVLANFRETIPDSALAQDNFSELLDSKMPLGIVCDIIAYTAGIPVSTKLALLAEYRVDRRAERLITALQSAANRPEGTAGCQTQPRSKFPPPFSTN